MESEKYRKFLRQQAEKNPVKIDRSARSTRFRISWRNEGESPVQSSSSDILDSLYLGKDMKETVVVDRRVAALLQDRLGGLEEENIRMRRRIKIMKFAIGALLIAVVVVSAILIKTYLPQFRILR
ncbi:MAG: hypothetical protein NWF14_07295 [Candidatus Bathyarchaeota archaeon]|nr:hypothetical protein [Candidatus Bathyarchaeota archaeon]